MKEQLLNLLYILTVMLPLFPGGVMVRFQTVQDRRLACHCHRRGGVCSGLAGRAVPESGQRTAGGHCLRSDGVSRRGSSARPWTAALPC